MGFGQHVACRVEERLPVVGPRLHPVDMTDAVERLDWTTARRETATFVSALAGHNALPREAAAGLKRP